MCPPPGWRAGGLYIQIIIVNERPSPLHCTCLEIIVESANVWVSKHTAEQIFRRPSLSTEEAPLVQTSISWECALKWGSRLRCGSCTGASMLYQKVFDALNCRVVRKVPSTWSCHPFCAHGIGAEGTAVTSVYCIPAESSSSRYYTATTAAAAQVQRRSHKVRVTSQDATGGCG